MSTAPWVREPAPAHASAADDRPSDFRGAADAAARSGDPAGQPTSPALGEGIRAAAGVSIAAGIVHAVATIDHFTHYWLYGVFFLVVTYGQVTWGAALWRGRLSARALRLGAHANLAIIAVWVLSRTVGVPFGPYTWDAEPIGLADGAATMDQLVLVAYVALILRPQLRVVRGLRVLLGVHRVRIGMMLCSASVFAGMLGGHQH